MTQIIINREQLFLSTEGHSGSAPAGQDIICAGVSALTLALLNTLRAEEEKRQFRLSWGMGPGKLHIKVNPKEGRFNQEARERIQDYFQVVETGLKALEEEYPANIIIIEEV